MTVVERDPEVIELFELSGGQELAIHTLAGATPEVCTNDREWAEAVRSCVSDTIALPLLIPDDFDYSGMIAKVVALRRERQANTIKGEVVPAITKRPMTDCKRGTIGESP